MKPEEATVVHSDSATTSHATGDGIEPDMVAVQGGSFAMGDNKNADEKPVHHVTLSSFKIAKYETTQALWQKVMGKPSSHIVQCADCPVIGASWDLVQTFIKKLNVLTGKSYRLPTEAEWEYAARGGTHRGKFLYAGCNNVDAVA